MAALLSFLVATVYAQTASLDTVLSRLDHPQDGDREVVKAAGIKAFQVLYPRAIARAKLFKTKPANPEVAEARLAATVSYLCLSADAGQTEKLLKLYDKVDERSQASLVFWFAQTGNANSIRPLFGRLFADAVDGEGTGLSDQIVAGLIRSPDSKAIDLLLTALQKPATDLRLRKSVFQAISITQDPRALKVMDRLRAGKREISPVTVRTADVKVKDSWTDSHGTKWSIGAWSGLGSPEDLWIFKWEGHRMVEPQFTGVSGYWPRSSPSGRPADGYEAHESEMRRLVKGGEWHSRLLKDQALSLDSDDDGYPDVVEKWLGLDPKNPDTDGDGLEDGVDKNPSAPQRTLSDTELALTAAFDAMECFEPDQQNILVTLPASVRPFEILGWKGLVLPEESSIPRTRSGAIFGRRISLGAQTGAPVKFSADHMRAEVEVHISGGWYESDFAVSVRKIGGTWYPVKSRMVSSMVS